jgi:membrane associated rhomboid family serine protease
MNTSFTITLLITIITGAISLMAFSNEPLKEKLLFWPHKIRHNREYHRFLSHGLVHADLIHLTFNMLAFYSFGIYVEEYLFSAPYLFGSQGRLFFILLYVGALILSSIPDYYKYKDVYPYRALGASGAVSAVIFAGIILRPNLPIRFLFIPFDIPGYIFGVIFLAFSMYMAKKGQDNIGHSAHFFGALYGVAFTVIAGQGIAGASVLKEFWIQIMGN